MLNLNPLLLNSAIITVSSETTEVTITGGTIMLSVMGDHLAYTGAYGSAIIRMSGCKNILNVINAGSSNEYLLSKVIATDMQHSDTRQELMCDVLRMVATR